MCDSDSIGDVQRAAKRDVRQRPFGLHAKMGLRHDQDDDDDDRARERTRQTHTQTRARVSVYLFTAADKTSRTAS